MSGATNSCATAIGLSAPGGVTPICAYGATQTTTAVTSFGDTFYSVGLHKCGGGCGGGDPERAKIVVTSPAGMAFDLFVYSDGACSTLVGSSTSGVLGGTERVNWVDGTCPAGTRTLRIEVKWRAGDGCGTASLSVTGYYTPYP
jgi:hypothetical protein